MGDWPSVVPVPLTPPPQEREKTYLLLVDMFVDIVEPDIIQMVLQNRNWDVDAALEDIMILTNSSQSDSAQHVNKTSTNPITHNNQRSKKTMNAVLQNENTSLNKFSPSYSGRRVFMNPQVDSQSKQEKQMLAKPFQYKATDAKKGNKLQLQPFMEQYSYVKATKIPFDRAVMLIKDGVKVMIILRGPPGSGKSYLARKLLLECGIEPSAHKRHIFSSDEFFVQNNVYVFVPELLSQAHLWNQRSVAAAVKEEVSPVIVDNTNTQAWEMRVYAEMAVTAGYDLEILEPDTWWFKRDGELAKRNVHGVPKAKIRQMIERYERNITPEMLMKQFDLRYSLLKAPPQPARNCKWRDKLSSQRNNKPKKKKSDFSPKSQNNLGNFNSLFQSLQINSPSFSQVESDFTVQDSNTSNFCFPLEVNRSKIRNNEESTFFSNEVNAKDVTTVPSSYKNGESFQGMNLDDSDTNRLFENLMDNPSSFLKSSSGPSKSSPDPVNIFVRPEQSNEGISSGNPSSQSNDSFDIMAETKKLLDALNKPAPFSTHSQKLDMDSRPSQTVQGPPQISVPENTFVCKGSEIFLSSDRPSWVETESDQTLMLEKENNLSSDDKTKVAHDLVNFIIDKAVNDAKCLDSKDHGYVDYEVITDRGLWWDYVIVNNDSTFTYQRNDSIPFGPPVVIADNTCITVPQVTVDSAHVDQTGHHCEIKSENLETASTNVDDESKMTISEKECFYLGYKTGSITNSNEDLKLYRQRGCKTESCMGEKCCQSNTPEGLCEGINLDFSDKNDGLQLESGTVGFEKIAGTGKKTESTERSNNPNVFEMMKNILCSLGPLDDNYNASSDNNVTSNVFEVKTSTGSDINLKSSSADTIGNSHTIPTLDSVNWNVGGNWDFNKYNAVDEPLPKPARNLRRPKLLTNVVTHQFNENDYPKYLGNWDTVCNPVETWAIDSTVKPNVPKNEVTALPQRVSLERSRINKMTKDSSTNTNYLDFLLMGDENNLDGLNVLTGNINNILSENCPEVKQNMLETLLLDKSTMTLDNSAEPVKSYDTTQITSLFPNIPEKYILDMVEKCQGDMDWAVDLLLDSEHNMTLMNVELEDRSSSKSDDGVKLGTIPPENISLNVYSKESLKRESKSPTHEQAELKKLLESSVVIDKSHYSDKLLKVLKRKHPEYVHLVENSPPKEDRNDGKLEIAEGSQDECKTEDEVDEVEEEEEISSSSCEVETEDDTMDLIMGNDLILQLQQKFGASTLPKITDITPIVKLPLSFARQLFGYIMDSLQSDMDQQQSLIEDMIARDEEVARLLQLQDQESRPQLQEVMDMEIALAMHRADQEDWKEKGNETLAAKLSRNILVEKFPQVDPKMLKEVLQAHNFSLSDTIDSLILGFGLGPRSSTEAKPQEPPPKEEKERITSIIVSDEIGATDSAAVGGNPVTEAAEHRAQAASYYSLRMECLSKAQDAFRSGNKTVATYYSQLAQMHKERMDQSNSKAAACLFSSHKTGTNTLDLHFLHIREAEVVLDMFLDEVITDISERNKRHQTVFLITGRGLRSIGGVSRIKPMVQRKLQARRIPYNEVNPGMLRALIRNVTPLSYTL